MINSRTAGVALWAIGTASLITSNVAAASSYAVSTNSISSFALNLPSSAWFGGFTFSGNIAVSLGALTGGDANISMQDAPAACVGSYCSGFNNSFTSHSAGPPPGYAYGDAQIADAHVRAGTGAASSIGEATAYNGLAGAAGANTMQASFTLYSPAALNFSFLADPYMSTQLSAGGLTASGNSGMIITIWQGSSKVFQWTPDGQAGGIMGGVETLDPFSLNLGIGSNVTYAPGADSFSAATNTFAAGTYSMNINMSNAVNVSAVPVPAALPLFGSGVLALAALVRRRRARLS